MKAFIVSLRALVFFTGLTGLVYPLLVTGLARQFFAARASGSLVHHGGSVVGSDLIAQKFSEPRYFWPRPSAVGYDATASGATNAAVTSEDWRRAVAERAARGLVGADLYASGSGLDPDITPESARAQADRVAQARGWPRERVLALVESNTEDWQFAFLGETRVNVLRLNLALDDGGP